MPKQDLKSEALAAHLTMCVFGSLEEMSQLWHCAQRFETKMEETMRGNLYQGWQLAFERTMG